MMGWGRGRGSVQGRGQQLDEDDLSRVQQHEQARIQLLSLRQCQELLARCLFRDPSLVFGIMASAPPPGQDPNHPDLCVCREMPTDEEVTEEVLWPASTRLHFLAPSCRPPTSSTREYFAGPGESGTTKKRTAQEGPPDPVEDHRQFCSAAYCATVWVPGLRQQKKPFTNSDQYLMEFLEDGGVLTLLEILSLSQGKDEEKTEALRLLLTVSNAGRKYKEIICESHGVKAIAEFLAKSNTHETQETAWAVLDSLSHGNPKYQNQIYKSLIALMSSTSPTAQQLVLHTLHNVQSKMKTAHHSIVEPLLNMLSSLHQEVQSEAINLILDLKCYDVRPALLSGLVALLRPNKEDIQQHQNMEESEIIRTAGSLPVFVQQAAAAKTIRVLAEDSGEVSRELLSLGVIRHLLYAMGNREHIDAQIQASLALKHFVHSYPVIEEHVQKVIGSTLFAAFMHKADTFYMNVDETQAEILLANKVNITVLDGMVINSED